MSSKRGFSLIELLVVVGIIAVLTAILMPVYVSAKRSAECTKCQSNLQQIAKAFESYTSDYNGCYPCVADDPATSADESDPCLWMGRHWRWPMKKYVSYWAAYNGSDSSGANQITGRRNSILECPSDPAPAAQYDKTSYGYSFAFYHTPEQIDRMTRANTLASKEPDESLRPKAVNTSMVSFPTKKAMVAEWVSAHSSEVVNWWSWGGSRNYLFVDGHVRYLSSKKIHPSVDNFPDINLTPHGVAGKDVD